MVLAFEERAHPLTRPPLRSATLSPRGEEGIATPRHILFSPAGRRCRQADEGATQHTVSNKETNK
ncbi:hypothetical protein F4V90_21820 [Neorhizobium galegae]|nr:hypothetical protein F4V90_21820 [Neorhizobium galegae]